MAETVRSLFDYRESRIVDSNGEDFKPVQPMRGRGCGRKRKGTPVKVFVSNTEEESVSEHNFSPGVCKEAPEGKRLTADAPFFSPDSASHNCGQSELAPSRGSKSSPSPASTHASAPAASSAPTLTPVPAPAPAPTSRQAPSLTPASTAPAAPTASAPAPTASSFPPPPNCRIREVHCGSQVRLVVIAIRDITKGEEITVDYSLTEWGENLVSALRSHNITVCKHFCYHCSSPEFCRCQPLTSLQEPNNPGNQTEPLMRDPDLKVQFCVDQ